MQKKKKKPSCTFIHPNDQNSQVPLGCIFFKFLYQNISSLYLCPGFRSNLEYNFLPLKEIWRDSDQHTYSGSKGPSS